MSAYIILNAKDKQKHHAYMHALEVQPEIVILILYSTVWRKILTVENFDESGLGKF